MLLLSRLRVIALPTGPPLPCCRAAPAVMDSVLPSSHGCCPQVLRCNLLCASALHWFPFWLLGLGGDEKLCFPHLGESPEPPWMSPTQINKCMFFLSFFFFAIENLWLLTTQQQLTATGGNSPGEEAENAKYISVTSLSLPRLGSHVRTHRSTHGCFRHLVHLPPSL